MSADLPGAVLIGAAAALAEIAGCYAFWSWLRLDGSPWWIAPGLAGLVGFATLLTFLDVAFAGRAFAFYGGVYIVMSLLWLWAVEGVRPSGTDLAGATLCLGGAALILVGPRAG